MQIKNHAPLSVIQRWYTQPVISDEMFSSVWCVKLTFLATGDKLVYLSLQLL